MSVNKDRLKLLLTETVSLLCQRGLTYKRELRVQGLLGITVDDDVFLVPLDERTSNNVHLPLCINHEARASRSCKSPPRQSDRSMHQVEEMVVSSVKADTLNDTDSLPVPTEYNSVDNEHHSQTAVKAEIVNDDEVNSTTENETQELHYVTSGEPENRSLQPQHPFPSVALGHFRNSTTVAQRHHASVDAGCRAREKRKRSSTTFGDDVLVLSPDNDEWTHSSQRETGKPVAGHSHGTTYGEKQQHACDELNGDQRPFTSLTHRRRTRQDFCGRNFVCQYELCNKAFFRKYHLIRHQLKKHGKPFGVDDQMTYCCYHDGCGKMFYEMSLLWRHMITVHNYGEKPYACDWSGCGLRFSRSGDLKRHCRKHTGIQPFSCHQCLRSFTRSDHLRRHLRQHASTAESETHSQDDSDDEDEVDGKSCEC